MTRKEVGECLEKHRDEIIQMRMDGYQCKEIGDKFGICRSSINGWLNRNGIVIRGQKTDEIIKRIIDMYVNQQISIHVIAKQLHFSSGTISDILKENHVDIRSSTDMNRIYTLDEEYFDVIDTPNKAYILGFLYADGCRVASCNGIRMNLQERDKHILEDINKEIGSNRPLRFIDYSHDPSRQNQYLLSIDSKHMADSLCKWGIVPCKEFVLDFPYWMNRDLVRHFIRGYLDGDGFISKNPKEKRMNFTGTEKMMRGIKEYFMEELNVHCSIFSPHHKPTVTRTLGIAGGNQVKKVLDHLYYDAEMYLMRKYKIYQNLYVSSDINNSQAA